MVIGAVSTASLASAVWSATTRGLTGLSSAINTLTAVPTILAISTVLDTRPASSSLIRELSLGQTGGTGTLQFGSYDGATFTAYATAPTVTGQPYQFNCGNGSGPVIKNTSGANTLTYTYSGWETKL